VRAVAITSVGCVTAAGIGVDPLLRAYLKGESCLRPVSDVRGRLPVPGFGIADVDVGSYLRRKKDKKLLSRSAELAIVAAHLALAGRRDEPMGIVMGVGREPSDSGEVESALLASESGGVLDVQRLAGAGLALYPPLTPLRTLPNLVLAHVAIQFGLTGESGTRAGEEAAGLAAVVEAYHLIREGRADSVLAGGAESLVDAGSARDGVRMGRLGPDRAPGEAAAMLLLESLETALAAGRVPLAIVKDAGDDDHRESDRLDALERCVGATGAAAGPLAVLLGLGAPGRVSVREPDGASAWLIWTPGQSVLS